MRQYQQQIDDDLELIEEEPESHDPQILRHIVLLILLLGSMFVVRFIIVFIYVYFYLQSRGLGYNRTIQFFACARATLYRVRQRIYFF